MGFLKKLFGTGKQTTDAEESKVQKLEKEEPQASDDLIGSGSGVDTDSIEPSIQKAVDTKSISKYPDWVKVREDLSHLPAGLLHQLQKAMVFIVLEDGEERAAVIARADKSEFQGSITSSTPMRLHIDFYSSRQGDVFGIYPLVFDNPGDPAFKETWLHAYDDPADIERTDPLAAETRKRMRLLLNQKYVWMIFVDNHDQILWVRKVDYTSRQIRVFQDYIRKIDGCAGKMMPKMQYFALINEYLNAVPMDTLQKQFLQLGREQPQPIEAGAAYEQQDRPFLMPVEDVFSIKGRGTVVCGRIERGVIKVGDPVEVIGLGKTRKTAVKAISMFSKEMDQAQAGDNVGLLLEGISKDEIERGQEIVSMAADTDQEA